VDNSSEYLLLGLKQGNKDVFEQIFKKYYTLLCIEARGYIRSYDLTEEIVCDIFTRLWQNRETLSITVSLRDYLIRALHNKCIDYLRRLQSKEFKNTGIENSNHVFTLSDLGVSPLEYILTQELEEKIRCTIQMLPPQYKRAFQLSRIKGLSYEQIAREMNLSVNSVKTNIKNALAFLRKELKDFL
jgi:RNA polymerase sigma-70 factor (ECF subfamily)